MHLQGQENMPAPGKWMTKDMVYKPQSLQATQIAQNTTYRLDSKHI